MGYELNGLIAHPRALAGVGPGLVSLSKDFALVPLTRAFWKERGASSHPLRSEWEASHASESDFHDAGERAKILDASRHSFRILTTLCAPLSVSASSPIAYVESHFFGGGGVEAAVVWERGEMVVGPTVASGVVNEALRAIGVPRTGDEFAELGLGRNRHTEDWLAVRNP